jgi:hypothetical protein
VLPPLTVIGNSNKTVPSGAAAFSVIGFHGSYADYTLKHNADGSTTVTNIGNRRRRHRHLPERHRARFQGHQPSAGRRDRGDAGQ